MFNKLLVIRKIFYCLWLLVVILGRSCFAFQISFQISRRANGRLARFNSIMPIFGSCRRVLITLEGWLNDPLRMCNYFFLSWVSSFKNYFAKGGGTFFYILCVCFFSLFYESSGPCKAWPPFQICHQESQRANECLSWFCSLLSYYSSLSSIASY